MGKYNGNGIASPTDTVHLKMFMHSSNATVPQTMIWLGWGLGGQRLGHQYGSIPGAGIASHL